jgi:hypothetical protein
MSSDFTYHRECVSCFSASSQNAFNQTSGLCLFFNSSASTAIDLDTIVYSSEFCGAPECQSQVLLPGIRLVPYWVMFASSVSAIVLSILVNLLKDYVLSPLKKRCCGSCGDGNNDDQKENIDEVEAFFVKHDDLYEVYTTARSFGMTDPVYYTILYISAIAHFVYIVVTVCTSSLYQDFSGWRKYETIYALWLNSGTIEVMCFIYGQFAVTAFCGTEMEQRGKGVASLPYYSGQFSNKMGAPWVNWANAFSDVLDKISECCCRCCLCLTPVLAFHDCESALAAITAFPLFVLPIFFTHILPAWFIFIPVFLLILLVWLGLAFAAVRGWLRPFGLILPMFVLRVAGFMCVFIFFQTFTNYAIMFYSGEYSWDEVIKYEILHRSTNCYFNAFVNGLQGYNVALAGLVFS